MAEWIGQLIAGFPSWLFIPAIIVVVAGAVIVFWLWATLHTQDSVQLPWKSKRVDLGEKKHAKK